MPVVDWLRRRWVPVDWIIAAYTTWMGLLIAWFSAQVDVWARLLTIHATLIVVLSIIPPRGAPWEARRWPHLWQRSIFQFVRFVRYVYPLPLALFFFEEGQFTVNMIFPETPYWFEPHLYAADTAIFGDLPARLLAPWVNVPLTEVAHFFYWSYYIILIGGVVIGYLGYRGQQAHLEAPAPGFDEVITGLGAAFIMAFLFYPWLAARGPWESPELIAGMPVLDGYLFTWMMDRIIQHGAVSGNCFPSGHMAAAWAIVFGLAWTPGHRRSVFLFGFLAIGMTFACVFTRYHHAVDMPAGFLCGLLGALLGGWLVRRGGGVTG